MVARRLSRTVHWYRARSDVHRSDRWHETAQAVRDRADRAVDAEAEIGRLLGGDDSAAMQRWRDRLGEYVERQGALDVLRLRPPSEPPWPADDNPMLGYLVERAHEIAAIDGPSAAIAWIGEQAWCEGTIAERARITRVIDAD